MNLHGLRCHPGSDHIILDLLPDDHKHHNPHRTDWPVGECNEHRQNCGHVGSDHRHELADQANPNSEHQCEAHPEQLESNPMDDEGNDDQDEPRHDVAASFRGADIPDLEHGLLLARRQQRADSAPELGTLGNQIEGEKRDGKNVEQRKNDGPAEVHQASGEVGHAAPKLTRLRHRALQFIQVYRIVDVVLKPCLE